MQKLELTLNSTKSQVLIATFKILKIDKFWKFVNFWNVSAFDLVEI
jgi:hypothetical protein